MIVSIGIKMNIYFKESIILIVRVRLRVKIRISVMMKK